MKQLIRRFTLVSIGVLCFFTILIFSGNKYEWMLAEDPAIVLPVDNDALAVSFVGLVPLTLYVICYALAKSTFEKILIIAIVIILLGFWLYKCRYVLFYW